MKFQYWKLFLCDQAFSSIGRKFWRNDTGNQHLSFISFPSYQEHYPGSNGQIKECWRMAHRASVLRPAMSIVENKGMDQDWEIWHPYYIYLLDIPTHHLFEAGCPWVKSLAEQIQQCMLQRVYAGEFPYSWSVYLVLYLELSYSVKNMNVEFSMVLEFAMRWEGEKKGTVIKLHSRTISYTFFLIGQSISSHGRTTSTPFDNIILGRLKDTCSGLPWWSSG